MDFPVFPTPPQDPRHARKRRDDLADRTTTLPTNPDKTRKQLVSSVTEHQQTEEQVVRRTATDGWSFSFRSGFGSFHFLRLVRREREKSFGGGVLLFLVSFGCFGNRKEERVPPRRRTDS